MGISRIQYSFYAWDFPRKGSLAEGHIADVLKTSQFDNALDLQETIMRYVELYNMQLPQSALGSRTPMQTMKVWYKIHPHLFNKRPYNRPGCDR